jgi:mannobiose 2-epimerase
MLKALKDLFGYWYPLTLDRVKGGYYSDISFDWQLSGSQDKMIVTQARHLWALSTFIQFSEDESMMPLARHGFEYIRQRFHDNVHGGVYWLLSREGDPLLEDGNTIKRAYGTAFAIYGLAAYHRVSGDVDALELARRLFTWMEEHLYDRKEGGYFQFSDREGNILRTGFAGEPPKDQNSSIHILEAFTGLFRVWPDAVLRDRLIEMLRLVRDRLTSSEGYLRLFFNERWEHVDYSVTGDYSLDHVSFGHDIETAYLLIEASRALEDYEKENTWEAAAKMVNHSIERGWDENSGCLFDGGFYDSPSEFRIIMPERTWWSQAEAMNTLLIFGDHFPDDSHTYHDKFDSIWSYIKEYIIDQEHGGWYWGGVDKQPEMKTFPKGSIWKGTYHNARALMNCIKRLRSE